LAVHGAGAAYTANRLFGAVYGVGVGMAGRCYAIPTKDKNIKQPLLFLDYLIRNKNL
jgi:hypothetical protein